MPVTRTVTKASLLKVNNFAWQCQHLQLYLNVNNVISQPEFYCDYS